MNSESKLTEQDVTWVKAYEKDVCETFAPIFKDAEKRFKDGDRLLKRFAETIDEVLKHGRGHFRAVDEAHNELCAAAAILQNRNPEFVTLEYEPALEGCEKTIDFRAKAADGLTLFIDVKTIKPVPTDRWEQFERARKEEWFPEKVELLFSKEWLGGELWHNTFAARGRMLEYTLELEQKIAECKLQMEKTFFVLLLCGEGFYWHEDELEDFVAFYFSGSHRSDDPFAKAEAKYMDEKKLKLTRMISRFACMRRPQGEVHKKRLNWNVQPPIDPSYL
jgi:hypothetical protein